MKNQLLTGLAVLLGLATSNLVAQDLNCSVVDGNGDPVPFVTVYAPASQMGMVSDADGAFALSEAYEISDTLRLSCLSYDDKYIAVKDLRGGKACPITLTQDAIELDRIVVRDEQIFFEEDTLGYDRALPTAFYDFSLPGVENGIILDEDTPMVIDRVDVQFGTVTMDSIYVELNFYELGEDRRPTKYLQKKRIIHRLNGPSLIGSTYSIDVSQQDVRSEKPLLITLKTLATQGKDDGKLWVAAEMTPGRALLRDVDGEWKEPGIHPLMQAYVRKIVEGKK